MADQFSSFLPSLNYVKILERSKAPRSFIRTNDRRLTSTELSYTLFYLFSPYVKSSVPRFKVSLYVTTKTSHSFHRRSWTSLSSGGIPKQETSSVSQEGQYWTTIGSMRKTSWEVHKPMVMMYKNTRQRIEH